MFGRGHVGTDTRQERGVRSRAGRAAPRPGTVKRVALTFDDGPDALTHRYLELLDDLGVPATFFVCGNRAEQHPAAHSRIHPPRPSGRGSRLRPHAVHKLSGAQLLDQLERTDQAIGGQVSGRPWVRPPHGSLDATSLIALRAAGYVVAMWSVDSCDYVDKDPGASPSGAALT